MTDFVSLQEDLTLALLSASQLVSINVVQLRKLRLQNEIDSAVIYTRTRNGRSGCGILVEMPTCECKRQNVTGPILDLICSFLVAEQPAINMNVRTGTQLTAEDVAQRVLDVFHLWQDEGMGGLVASGRPIEPVEYMPGIIAYRVRLQLLNPRSQTARVANPVIAVEAGLMTITSTTADAEIDYTIDESFPAKQGGGNSASQLYSAPFAVESGDIIRVAAYKEGLNVSNIKRYEVA